MQMIYTHLTFSSNNVTHLESAPNEDLAKVNEWRILLISLKRNLCLSGLGKGCRLSIHLLPSLSIMPQYIKLYLLNLLKYVDEKLAWNVHIDNIAKEIASGIGILKRSRPFVTFEVLSTIYSALLVQPYFDYCRVVWGICNKSLAIKLQKLQNRAARILTFSPYDASVDNLFTSLAWKKLEAQR